MESNDGDTQVSLSNLAELAGLPVELIKKELFQDLETENLTLEEVRKAMTSYLDKTMIEED